MSALQKQRFLQQYTHTSVHSSLETATPHRLVSMLYKGALDRLAQAKGFMERRDFARKGETLGKAMAIISALRSGLDHDHGKEVSNNLDALYEYFNRRLLEASRNNDVAIVDEIQALLKGIADAWDAMPDNFKSASETQLNRLKSQ